MSSLLWDEPAEGMGDLSDSSRRQWVIRRQLRWVRGPGDSCFKETCVSLLPGPTTTPENNTKPEVSCPWSQVCWSLEGLSFRWPCHFPSSAGVKDIFGEDRTNAASLWLHGSHLCHQE